MVNNYVKVVLSLSAGDHVAQHLTANESRCGVALGVGMVDGRVLKSWFFPFNDGDETHIENARSWIARTVAFLSAYVSVSPGGVQRRSTVSIFRPCPRLNYLPVVGECRCEVPHV